MHCPLRSHGGIGRRTGFRYQRPQGRSGSTPDGTTEGLPKGGARCTGLPDVPAVRSRVRSVDHLCESQARRSTGLPDPATTTPTEGRRSWPAWVAAPIGSRSIAVPTAVRKPMRTAGRWSAAPARRPSARCASGHLATAPAETRGCRSTVGPLPSKQSMRVRFPPAAPRSNTGQWCMAQSGGAAL